MIFAMANVNILLPCLAVLCALLLVGIIALSLMMAISKLKDKKMMQNDVYVAGKDILNVDFAQTEEDIANDGEVKDDENRS